MSSAQINQSIAMGFDLFRLNCMLGDSTASSFNKILESVVLDYLFEHGEEVDSALVYDYLVKDLALQVSIEVYDGVIANNEDIIKRSDVNYTYLKLLSDKCSEIENSIKSNDVQKQIDGFLKKNDHPNEKGTIILEMLNTSVYENINSFASDNIKSIVSKNLSHKFAYEDISLFNDFLSYDDIVKNNVLYKHFLKAVEFAIATSGKGVKSFSANIFSNKTYLIDANVIFRYLGVGGAERKANLEQLFDMCHHQGIKFIVSNSSYQEFRKKLTKSANFLEKVLSGINTQLAQDVFADSGVKFNQDFVSHYLAYQAAGVVISPEMYDTMLIADFNSFCRKYNIEQKNPVLDKKATEKISNSIWDEKHKNRSFYTREAAQVDANNIIYVQQLRGSNNHNYANVRSFYLTTDKSLNQILDDGGRIPETILPSQLYLLHSCLSGDTNDVDFATFTSFLKKRTVAYKYSGKDILRFVSSLQSITADSERASDIIKAYTDKRYENSKFQNDELSHLSFKDFASTEADKKFESLNASLDVASKRNESLDAILNLQKVEICRILRNSLNLTKGIDISIITLLLPIASYFIKKIFDHTEYENTVWVIILLVLELFKFVLSSKTTIFQRIWRAIYNYTALHGSFYRAQYDKAHYRKNVKDIFPALTTNIWTYRLPE